MPISFQCPHCSAPFAAPDEFAGRQARCQACKNVVTVPAVSVTALQPLNSPDSGIQPFGDPLLTGYGQGAAPVAGGYVAAGYANRPADPFAQQTQDLQPLGPANAGMQAPLPSQSAPANKLLVGTAIVAVTIVGCVVLLIVATSLMSGGDSTAVAENTATSPALTEASASPVAERPAFVPTLPKPVAPPPAKQKNVAAADDKAPVPSFSRPMGAARENIPSESKAASFPESPVSIPAPEMTDRSGSESKTEGEGAPEENLFHWAAQPDPPPAPLEFKKGKFDVEFPRGTTLHYPHGPSHFVMAHLADQFKRREARQVFDLRTGRSIGKEIERDYDFLSEYGGEFSPDGRYFALAHRSSGGFNNNSGTLIKVWSFATGDVHREIVVSGERLSGPIRFGAAHQMLTIHSPEFHTEVLTLWDLNTGKAVREVEFSYSPFDKNKVQPESLAVSPGGKYAVLTMGKMLGLLDLTTGEAAGQIPLNTSEWNKCEAMVFSHDGAELASLFDGFGKQRLYIWDMASGKTLLETDLDGFNDWGYGGAALEWVPDKSALLVSGHLLIEHNTGGEVWEFPRTDNTARRMIRPGEMLVLMNASKGKALQTAELPKKDIEKALLAVRDGGAAADSALPPLTTANLFSASGATLPNGFTEWRMQADAISAMPKGVDREVLLAKPGERVHRVMFAAPSSAKVVVQKEITPRTGPGRRGAKQMAIERVDINSGSKGLTLSIPNVYQLVDASPSGLYGLVAFAQKEHHFSRKGSEYDRLDVISLTQKKHIAGWRPYAGEKKQERNDETERGAHFRFGWHNNERVDTVVWGAMIDDTHVLTVNSAGKLVCWQLPECKATYYFEDFGRPLALSPSRRYLAGVHNTEFRLFDALTGECVGDLEAPAIGSSAIRGAFRPDGQELSAVIDAGADKMLCRWDLTTGKLTQEFPIPPQTIAWRPAFEWFGNGAQPGLEYRGDNYLLLDDQYLVDLEKRSVVWKYHLTSGYYAADPPDRKTWYCVRRNDGRDVSVFLTFLETPGPNTVKKAANSKLEDDIVLGPGGSVRLSIDLSSVGMGDMQPTVESALREALELRGLKIGSAADLTLSVTASQRSTGEKLAVQKSPFGSPFGSPFSSRNSEPSQVIDQQEMVIRIALINGTGKTYWHRESAARMRNFGAVGNDVQGELRKEMMSAFKSHLTSLGAATKSMPRYIFKDLSEILAGESDLGFKEELPPPSKKAPTDGASPMAVGAPGAAPAMAPP